MEDENINSIITSLAPWNAADNSLLYFFISYCVKSYVQ